MEILFFLSNGNISSHADIFYSCHEMQHRKKIKSVFNGINIFKKKARRRRREYNSFQ